jgi:hypothetical protein
MSELPTTEPMTPDERIALLEREVSAAQYRIERDGAEIERLRSQLTDFHNIDDVGEIKRLRDALHLIAEGTYTEKGAEDWAKCVLRNRSADDVGEKHGV